MADNPIKVKAYGKILNFPAGTAPEAIESALAEHEHVLNPDYKTPQPEALDYAKGFASGANKLVSGVGFLAEAAGAKETGKAIRAFGDRGAKYWNDKMSKGGKLASESQVFVDDDNEDSVTGIKLSDDWGKALLMGASQSLPSMFAAAIPGVAVTKGIQALAKLGLAGGAGATIPLLAGTAAPVGVASNIIARVPSAVGFGVAEGVTAGAMNAADFKTSIEGMTDEELNKSPVYRVLKEEHDPETARGLLAEQAALDLFGKTAVSTGTIGALTGGGALSQAYQKVTTGAQSGILGTMLKGAGSEALQETPQSGGEKFIENLTTQKFLDPGQSTTEGVLAAAASGGAIGAFTGGVVGAGGAINVTPDRRAQVLNEKRKIAAQKAEAVNARTMEESAADINAAQDIDQVLAAATRATAKPVVSANEVLRSEDPTLADIEKLTGLKPTEAIDTAIDEIESPIIDQPQETENVSNQETQQAPTAQASVLEKTVASVQEQERVNQPIAEAGETLTDKSPVLKAEVLKAKGIKTPYDQYLKEHPNRKVAASVDLKKVEGTILKGLESTGKFGKKTRETYATPFREFYKVNAERQGILPSELYERLPLKFSGKQEGKILNQDGKNSPAARNKVNFDLKDATPDDFTPERVSDLLNRNNWAILTAANPMGKSQSDAQNVKANEALKKELADRGLAYEVVQGRYPGDTKEMESYLVYGADRKVANELGNKYKQDSVLTREGLIHSNGKATPVKTTGKGSSDGYTRVPRTGAKFAFDLDWSKEATAAEGALSLVGRHYSKEQRAALEGARFGQGYPGNERDRISESDDPRLKSRVDFYVDIGNGITPESGLGSAVHETLLHNIYDGSTNPRKFKYPSDRLGGNVFEKQVLDAGYDGYYIVQGKQGRVVMLGDAAKSIPIEDNNEQRESELLAQSSGKDTGARESDGSLKGLPRQVGQFKAASFRKAQEVAKKYMKTAGLEYNPPTEYVRVNEARAKRIAQAFDEMKHDPQNPEVKAAYDALVRETTAQYKAVVDSGLKVEFIDFDKTGDPYEGSPRAMTEDVRSNNHMWVFSTRDGFGSSEFDPADNPLLAETEFEISGQKALVNDLFRVVHDYFGHVKEGVGFRAAGEENAWMAHMAMFSPLAGRALTTETRGQNSWVNYGPFAEHNKTASGADTKYADQKIGLLPEWASTEGRVERPTVNSEGKPIPNPEKFHEWFGDSKVVDNEGRPLVVYRGDASGKTSFEPTNKGLRLPGNIFFTDNAFIGRQYARGRELYSTHLRLQNPYTVNAEGNSWSEVPAPTEIKEEWGDPDKTMQIDELALWARGKGFDGLIVRDVLDQYGDGTQYVVFNPTQIKSAVGNNGEFNPKDSNILHQSNFYSALEKEIGNLKKIANKNGEVSVEQAKAWINSRQKEGKFKQAEVEAVGLLDWLDTLEGKVPVTDVEEFVQENGVQVEEVVLEGSGEVEIDEDAINDEAYQDFVDGHELPEAAFDDAIKEVADEMLDNPSDERWDKLIGLSDADEIADWKEDEGVDSRRDMVRFLKHRNDAQEILGDDKYYEIRDEYEQYDWEQNQDYYLDRARERAEEEAGGASGGTEFSNYVLRGGGSEYKELLLTLPNSKARFDAPHFDKAQEDGAENIFAHTRINEREMDAELTPEQTAEKETYAAWEAGNNTPEIKQILREREEAGREYRVALEKWKERMVKDTSISDKEYEQAINTLSSNPPAELKPFIARIDEASAKVKELQEIRLALKPKEPSTSGAKEKVLFVEEIQSDWAQEGRDEGFLSDKPLFTRGEVKAISAPDPQATQPELFWYFEVPGNVLQISKSRFPTEDAALDYVVNVKSKDNSTRKIPTAPFVTDTKAWTALVVKRLLRYAAENGFDRIAWTTGAQQAERYRLSKFVEKITAARSKDGKYYIRAEREDGSSVIADYYEENKLAGTIGKELAEKIIKQPDGDHVYEGLDLDVGGQGMREFYDRIVPSVVNDVAKKLGGGKVETVSMGGQAGRVVKGLGGKILITYPNGSYLKNRNTGVMTESQDRADGFESVEEATKFLDRYEAQNLDEPGRQMSLRITPALKDKVMQGLPLFQRDRAGFNPRTFTISLMDGSDLSSVIHEGGHFYLEALAEMASQPNAPEQIVNDFDTTLQWFGIGEQVQETTDVTTRTQGYPTAAGEPVATFRKADDIKTHPRYAEAKAGDDQAAFDLVSSLVTEENLSTAATRFKGATFVPVSMLDKDGANRIPTALAYHYANAAGGFVSDSIFESRKAYHTGMNAMERLVSRADFSGKVEPGRKYVLVDDVTTVGSTLADLASYIQENGGEVIGSVLLANATRSGNMFANVKTLKRLEAQYGNEIRELFNIEPSALTQEEAQYLIGFRNADELRSSAVKAQGSRLARIHARKIPKGQSSVDQQRLRDIWQSMPLEQKRPYHEQWAQSFERYALEGKAPTEEMQSVFDRFKEWMLDVYESLKEFLKQNPLAGKLNNEVRSVFDRLLASERAIEETKKARGLLKQSGKTPPTESPVQVPKPVFNPNTDIPETLPRKAQRLTQDAFNRFTVIQNWLKEKGVTLSEKADVYQAEERYNSLVANQLEDFREQKRNPLIEKIAKAGFTMADVSDFLEAQHAAEANAAIQKISNNDTDTAYGITDKEAADYLAKADPKLATLANELRDITEESKQMRLKAGLLSQEEVDAWESTYEHYIPVKGDADAKGGTGKGLKVNFKTKRRLGHGKRDEAVIENIFLDHERAIMQVEKNRVAKHLVMMAAEMQMPEIMTVGQPVKRKTLRSTTAYEVKVSGVTRSVFNNKQAADMFKQLLPDLDKGVSPNDISVEQTKDQRIVAMASPMLAENEINAYIDGHAIRVQINDDLLARAYAKLGVTGFSALVSAGRAFNGYLSKVYTGYNPEFILTNMIRDFTSGLINLTGEEGIKMAAKASGNYVKSFSSLMRYAVSNGKKSDKWIDMYRANGGNTGAAYLSDLERLGDEVKTEYAAYQGVMANLKSGSFVNASRAAGRKVFNLTLKWIYNLNQAGENAMRLAAFRAMIESGKTPAQAAKAAKNITVNFNRKGELGAEANAAYLFFNASVQGVAALAHAHFKGKNKYQAWGLSSMVGVLGYMSAVALLGGDDDEYDKLNDYTKSRNLLIKAGDGYAQIPIPYGYGFFWNMGRSIAEAQHKGELGVLPWHIAASAIEELTPFSDTVVGTQDGFHFDQVLLGLLPTVIKIPAQPAFNKQLFSGSELMPDSAFQQFQPDREKLWRATQGTMYDRMSGWLDEAIGADVSPETLKHYTRTFTGGAGAMVDATVSAAILKKEGAELEPSEIPFVRKAYSKLTIREHRAAYYKAREEAKKTAEEFTRAKARNDITTINKIVKDEAEMIGLDAYANKLSKAISAMRDMQDAIRLDDGLNAAEKRVKIKELEITEQKFYDQYLDVFKIEKAKMKARND